MSEIYIGEGMPKAFNMDNPLQAEGAIRDLRQFGVHRKSQ
jgi:hypothetical protein